MPHLTKPQLTALIRARDFSGLFIQLGWDKQGLPKAPFHLSLDDRQFPIVRVAEKRGFVVCVCEDPEHYPSNRADRRRLTAQLARHHYEHLLIICGDGKQCWSVAIRPQNRPVRTVEVEWHESQNIQRLMEKLDGMIFDLSEEDNLGITDVVERVRSVFMEGAEKVTRKFYAAFSKELAAFAGFIKGIRGQVQSKEWYAALMLNRLMFIYFMQKKRFLDGDPDYLETRLRRTQETYGADKFHDRFYRHFLRRLFAEGLGAPESERDPQLKQLLGKVPYLNGGLFDLHEIERENTDIQIPDRAFENLFAFFKEYEWHLDTRASASGKDINPDVIGYIFEKYINERAAMGAYYTQEDVTGYIARNTIIPWLLHRAKEKCRNAFDADNGIWRFLRENPDAYIYEAVKHGCGIPDSEIPEKIRRGIDANAPDLLARRKHWNTKTDERFALPTEIWRETIARRERYFALREKIANGEIREIDDLITYNLDIEKFAANALGSYEGSDFIAAFYETIAGRHSRKSNQLEKRGISVLDPACGSGAFLFAALNILEPLYERCIERMRDFVDEDEKLRAQGGRKGGKTHPHFRAVLAEIDAHQNQRYWIYKTIILNNLYGVDLMKEAAEIAKLRLFLKLAAEAEYAPKKGNLGLEPLPDIDFNIRAGNSLVGFVNMAAFDEFANYDSRGQKRFDAKHAKKISESVREKAEEVRMASARFKGAQDAGGGAEYQKAKRDLSARLDALNEKMSRYLADQYGKDTDSEYQAWRKSHQPFHWLAEFYGIIEGDGGFDVVVGNPPYVQSRNVTNYSVMGYETGSCNNLYTYLVEVSLRLLGREGVFSMIIPISFAASKKMMPIRKNVFGKCSRVWASHFAIRPQPLFNGVMQRNTIVIGRAEKCQQQIFTTNYQRWVSAERGVLFHRMRYIDVSKYIDKENFIYKVQTSLGINVLNSIHSQNRRISNQQPDRIYIHNSGESYWTKAAWEKPVAYRDGVQVAPSHWIALDIPSSQKAFLYLLLNSNLFYWMWTAQTDCRDITKSFLASIRLPSDDKIGKRIVTKLMNAQKQNTKMFEKRPGYKSPEIKVHDFKPLIDEVDTVLAKHYGLTDPELDYIINYDIKYRLGLYAN